MKNIITRALILSLVTQTLSLSAADFYVSLQGNDQNTGTQEKPFATLERARTAARAARGSRVTVWLTGGLYDMTQTFELTHADSGTVYRSTEGGVARLCGGRLLPASVFSL